MVSWERARQPCADVLGKALVAMIKAHCFTNIKEEFWGEGQITFKMSYFTCCQKVEHVSGTRLTSLGWARFNYDTRRQGSY